MKKVGACKWPENLILKGEVNFDGGDLFAGPAFKDVENHIRVFFLGDIFSTHLSLFYMVGGG